MATILDARTESDAKAILAEITKGLIPLLTCARERQVSPRCLMMSAAPIIADPIIREKFFEGQLQNNDLPALISIIVNLGIDGTLFKLDPSAFPENLREYITYFVSADARAIFDEHVVTLNELVAKMNAKDCPKKCLFAFAGRYANEKDFKKFTTLRQASQSAPTTPTRSMPTSPDSLPEGGTGAKGHGGLLNGGTGAKGRGGESPRAPNMAALYWSALQDQIARNSEQEITIRMLSRERDALRMQIAAMFAACYRPVQMMAPGKTREGASVAAHTQENPHQN